MWIHLFQLNLIWDLEKLNWIISTHRSVWYLRGMVLRQTHICYWAHIGTSVCRPHFYLLTWPRSPESKPASEICWYLMFVRQLCAAACSCLSTVEALSARLNAKVETDLCLAGCWYFQSSTAKGSYMSVTGPDMNSSKQEHLLAPNSSFSDKFWALHSLMFYLSFGFKSPSWRRIALGSWYHSMGIWRNICMHTCVYYCY